MPRSIWIRRWEQWVAEKKMYVLIGLSGVSHRENSHARRIGRLFLYLSVVIAIVLLMQWHLELLNSINLKTRYAINVVVWGFFILQYVVCFLVVRDKGRYVRQNWFLPIVTIVGLFFIFNITSVTNSLDDFRPFFAIIILLPSIRLLVLFFLDGQLRTTLLAALVLVIIFGVLVAGVDPAVKNIWDGMWWAVATVSTVGYGDIVPVSPLGRLIGVALIVMGLGVFVVITANFLALTLRKEAEKFKEEEQEVTAILHEVKELKERQQDIILSLKNLEHNLKKVTKPKDG